MIRNSKVAEILQERMEKEAKELNAVSHFIFSLISCMHSP